MVPEFFYCPNIFPIYYKIILLFDKSAAVVIGFRADETAFYERSNTNRIAIENLSNSVIFNIK